MTTPHKPHEHPHDTPQELPDYVQLARARAVAASGVRLYVTDSIEVEHGHELQYASGSEPHILRYHPTLTPHLPHMILDASTRIRRMWEAEPHRRVRPEPTGRFGGGLTRELEIWAQGQPPAPSPRVLYQTMTRALTILPTALRLQREIAEAYPDHATFTSAFGHTDLDWLAATDAWYAVLPSPLDRALYGMREAHREECYRALGEPTPPIAEESTELGASLADMLYQGVPSGHEGDVVATERWAYTLGLEDAYHWRRLPN